MTIVEFLEARLTEDLVGVAIIPPHPQFTDRTNDRDYKLADIAAKRSIVKWCGEREQIWVGTIASNPELANPKDFAPGHLKNPADSMVLRYMAAVYSEHPDYDEDWKP